MHKSFAPCMLPQQRSLHPGPPQLQQQQRPGHHTTAASSRRARRRQPSTLVASLLDRLNIQPLSVPAEARQLQQHPPPAQGASSSDTADECLVAIPPLDAWGTDPFLMACCEPEAAPLRVAVLVSGGVDSSLALQLVAAAGHAPTAFYLQIWFQEDFRNFWDACPWEEDLRYAREVCEGLGVPLVVVPLTQEYWDRVVGHSVAEIKAGRTPNPDMLCNSRVKFGAFVEYLEREHGASFDRIASGHYARVVRVMPDAAAAGAPAGHNVYAAASTSQTSSSTSTSSSADLQSAASLAERRSSHAHASSSSSSSSSTEDATPSTRLMMVPDAVKDQTYFLAGLSPAQLARCMFPLGGFTKPQVRALATAAGLATSGRKDSQGICFLGKVKFGEFVREHLGEWPGPLVEEDSGQVVGVHEGYWFYTVGQRGGIKLPGGPWYVTGKDMAANTVFVSRAYYEQHKRRDAFVCGPCNWLVGWRRAPRPDRPLQVKVRHGPSLHDCRLVLGGQDEIMRLLDQGVAAPLLLAPGDAICQADGGGQLQQGEQQQLQQEPGGSAVGVGDGTCGDYGLVLLSSNDQGLASGQFAVFYQDGECLGSAQILGTVSAHTDGQLTHLCRPPPPVVVGGYKEGQMAASL